MNESTKKKLVQLMQAAVSADTGEATPVPRPRDPEGAIVVLNIVNHGHLHLATGSDAPGRRPAARKPRQRAAAQPAPAGADHEDELLELVESWVTVHNRAGKAPRLTLARAWDLVHQAIDAGPNEPITAQRFRLARSWVRRARDSDLL